MPMISQPGSYRVKVVAADLCKSLAGKEQVAVVFEVMDEGPERGHHLTWFGSFSDAAFPYTMERMRTLGWQGSDLCDLSTLGSAGEVEIVCSEEEYNGKTQIKVQFINALGSAGMGIRNTMDEGEKRAFAARMRALVVGTSPGVVKSVPKKSAGVQARPPQEREEPPPHTDDDIPF